MPRRSAVVANYPSGLPAMRRSGTVTELLFLYDCATRESDRLAPIADRLGITVQAASHRFRSLARRGLLELREGRYRPTVAGVAWLHGALDRVGRDVAERLERLHIVRSCRAVAVEDLRTDEPVSLGLEAGVLSARRGSDGPSRGRAGQSARRGELVRVVDLEGILPIPRGRVTVLSVPESALGDPALGPRLQRALPRGRSEPGLLAAPGLEAHHLLSRVVEAPVLRFGISAAVAEASRLGVDSTVVVLESELSRFLEPFSGPDPPPLRIVHLAGGAPVRRATSRRRRR